MGLLLSGKNPAAYKTAERSTFTATAGQTTFTVPVGYNVGDIDVFLNGLKLVEGDDFFATNGTTVVLASGANVGDSLSVICYYNFLNSSSYTKAESDNRYIQPNGQTSMSSYLRTPNYGISSTSDSLSTSLEASAFAGEQGVGIKAFGRSIASTGGDILYTTDSRGAGGRHRFGYWNGTSFTETLIVDSSGRMTLPYQPSFKAGRSGNLPDGYTGVVVFNSVYHNIGNHYNSSNGRFTAPITGTYMFAWMVLSQNASATMSDASLKVNGSVVQNSRFYSADAQQKGTAIIRLNAGEYVEYNKNNGSGVAGSNVYGDPPWSTFSGHFLG